MADDSTRQTLVVKHSIDTSKIGNSSIYNATTKELVVCQIIQLITDTSDMTIIEDKRQIKINFNLDYNFEINNIVLDAATIKESNETADVDSYINACKCNADGTACEPGPLVANTELNVCIYSSSDDVLIDYLESMVRVNCMMFVIRSSSFTSHS